MNYGFNLIVDYAEHEPNFNPKHGFCGYEAVAQMIHPETNNPMQTMVNWANDKGDKKISSIVTAGKPLKTN